MKPDADKLTTGLYLKLTNEEDSQLCEDISEAACRETPCSD
jgi:hypothetical protein